MGSSRWDRTQSLFHEAVVLPDAEWATFLLVNTYGDDALAREVLGMLKADAAGPSLLDNGLEPLADLTLSSTSVYRDQQIGPYKLVRVLGEGGMGVVWLAQRRDTDTLVAIKFLLHAGLSPERRARFAHEIRTLGRLKNPYIARFYDAGTLEDGAPWLVMEYVEGSRITDFCNQNGLDTKHRLALFSRVCEAVRYAHSQEVIHRDLKPSNILVEKDGTPRLLDFGIARELDMTGAPSEHTARGFRFLSPEYAAPEWLQGGSVGLVTDVYALGVILFELLTRQLPPQSSTPYTTPSTTHTIAESQYPSRTAADYGSLTRSSWDDLDVLCTKALHHDPGQRYSSVEALLEDLKRFSNNQPLQARPDSFRYRASKFFTRNRSSVLATTAAFLLVLGLITFFSLRLRRERDHAVLEEARSQHILRIMLDMLGNGDTEAGPSNDLKVLTLLDRAALEAGSRRVDADVQIELDETIGSMYDRLGNYEKSSRVLSAGLEKARSSNTNEVLPLLVERGTVYSDVGDLKAAKRDLDEAIATAATLHLKPLDPAVIQAKLAIGRFHVLDGSFNKAIAELEPLTHLDSSHDSSTPYDVRDSLSYLSNAMLQVQDFTGAETAGRKAIAMDRVLLGEGHAQTGVDLINLASIRATLRDFSQAEQLYRQGLNILSSWYGPDHPDVETASSFLAFTLTAQGKDEQAKALLEQALRVQLKTYGPVHERVAMTRDALGDIAMHQQLWKEAELDYREAAEIDRKQFGESSAREAIVNVNLAKVYLEESRPAAAEKLLQQSVDVFVKLPPGNTLIAVARGRWGRSLLALGRYQQAQEQLTAADSLFKEQKNPPYRDVQSVRSDLALLRLKGK